MARRRWWLAADGGSPQMVARRSCSPLPPRMFLNSACPRIQLTILQSVSSNLFTGCNLLTACTLGPRSQLDFANNFAAHSSRVCPRLLPPRAAQRNRDQQPQPPEDRRMGVNQQGSLFGVRRKAGPVRAFQCNDGNATANANMGETGAVSGRDAALTNTKRRPSTDECLPGAAYWY